MVNYYLVGNVFTNITIQVEIWYFQSGPGMPEQPECGVYPLDLCRYGSDCQTDGINWRK